MPVNPGGLAVINDWRWRTLTKRIDGVRLVDELERRVFRVVAFLLHILTVRPVFAHLPLPLPLRLRLR